MTTALCGRFRDTTVVKTAGDYSPPGQGASPRPAIRVRGDRPRTRISASEMSEFLREDRWHRLLRPEGLLSDEERAKLKGVRDFLVGEAQPLLTEYWSKAIFPHQLVPGIAALGIAGTPYTGYGCPGDTTCSTA